MGIWQQQFYIDIVTKQWLNSIASPTIDVIMNYVTNFGSPLAFYIMTAGGLTYFVYRRKMIWGIFLVTNLFATWAIMNMLKVLFMRERPVGEHLTYATGYSFPSGHAMLSLVFYGFIMYYLLTRGRGKWVKTFASLLVLLILLIGVSRIYLNVHFATDVLGGFILGGVLLIIFIQAFRFIAARY